jgi:hypothetical protein
VVHSTFFKVFSKFCGFVVFLAFFSPGPGSAQQPKVLAPHQPVAPRLPDQPPSPSTYTPRYLRGGFWMTEEFTKSSVYVRSDLEISSLPVIPVLYLSNGVQLTLPAIELQPSGTAVININDALASQGIAPHARLSGYVELQYQWPWNALCATVSSVDAGHSVIFTYGLSSMSPSSMKGRPKRSVVIPVPGAQVLEGAWWKEETDVTGFVALSNTTDQPLPATVQVTDADAKPLGSYELTISPHGTKSVDLQELRSPANMLGGLHVTFNGLPDALIVNGGLEDSAKGYSASIPFGAPPPESAKTAGMSYAEIGLMAGGADPMMRFPAGTVFTPYSVLRNLGAQPLAVTPVIYWMEGGAARSARQASFSLGPLQTKSLDVLSLLALSGLKNFNGALNLILEVEGTANSLLLASGSVDQTHTYVFEVIPRGILESGSKNLSYWSTANGDDTMVTLWNPADEAQDFVFKILFSGGHYLLPIHLEPRATQAFNVSEVIEAQAPDKEGNVIPLAVREGSAQVSGTQAENEIILVAMDAGIYNVRKATCAYICNNCNGVVSSQILTVPFATAVGGSTQLTHQDTWNTGVHHDITRASTWSSSATSVATVNTGLVQGVGVGSVIINGVYSNDPWAGQVCGSPPPACPPDSGVDDSGGGNVKPTISGPNTLWWFNGLGLGVSGYTTQITLTASSGGTGSSYQWAIASGSDKVSLSTSTSATVQVTSTGQSSTANDVSITVTVGGIASDPFTLTVRAPYTLGTDPNHPSPVYSADSTFAWVTDIYYRVLDNFLVAMPVSLPINEFLGQDAPDYTNENWQHGGPGCADTSSTAVFFDFIQGVNISQTPTPYPTPVYNTNWTGPAVYHFSQDWRVGTCTIGSGPRVQTDALQRYTDHAAHNSIVSPAP